jgi:hypothetical protein
MPYPVPAIPYLRLRLTLRAEEPAMLPPYQGSMLRGAFGHALRRMVCTMGPDQPCATCMLRRTCFYTRIFEPYVEGEPPPFLRGIDQEVRPYVFEPQGGAGPVEPGETLSFDLLLFGQAVELQAYAVLAVERMAQAGLGVHRARFRLARVEALGASGGPRTLFSEGTPLSFEPAQASLPAPGGPAAERYAVRFATPLRLKMRDRLADRPGFRDLVFNALRRVLELAHFHVPGAAIEWGFRPFLEQTSAVRVVAEDLAWHDWERWSNRQGTAMKLGGVVGTLVLAGNLEPFLPLLRTAEVVHVGKGATFGLGKIVVEAAPVS